MKNPTFRASPGLIPLAWLLLPVVACAQVPVDEDGGLIDARGIDGRGAGAYEGFDPATGTGEEGIPLLDPAELEELVDVIALYPDDLLAIVLPASTYPLQVVQAARFLEDVKADPTLEPNPEWDDSVIALLNYPEVVALLNEDLDWTWRLGEAVVAQQADVFNAVESFRNRAYAAGNLQSDRYQTVTDDGGIIEITPVNDEIIYVPYYEPTRVVSYQSRPVYHYYPEPCPVYYYPYPSNYIFNRGHFWGVTTAFSIGWTRRHLNVFHHSYGGHPYFGVRYWDRWWYRRPTINVHNTVYVNNRQPASASRYYQGDSWRPRRNTWLRHSDRRISSNTYVPRREAIGVSNSSFSPAHRANTANRTTRTPATNRRAAAEPRTTVTQPRWTTSTTRRGHQSRQRNEAVTRERRRTDSAPPVTTTQRNRSTSVTPRPVRQPSATSERRAATRQRQPDRRPAAPPSRSRASVVPQRQSRSSESRPRVAEVKERRSTSRSPKEAPVRKSTRRR